MKTPEEIKNYYNAIAPGYEELYHLEQEKKITLIKEKLPKNGIHLDAGSGDGVLYKFIKDFPLEVYALDISEELLRKNPFKNKILSSIEEIKLENDYFTSITSFTVLQDVYDKKKAIEQLHRILKKEGILILSFLKMSRYREEIEKEIKKKFTILEKKEEEKDIIIICEKEN